jgi:DNA helicase IV
MENNKHTLIEKLKKHIAHVQERIRESLKPTEEQAHMDIRKIARLRPEEQPVYMQIKGNAMRRLEELHRLIGSPYFTRCHVQLKRTGEYKTYYFAKHQFGEENIYSWFAPVSSIRFDTPGEVSYRLPNGETQSLNLLEKDQYMIVDGRPIFFSTEGIDKPRELIYQEHFTTQKSEFILPEIVAQMEKAQDQVIRASYRGPILIAGPAGSGKTTLALHRVAYLTQAPDTALNFPEDNIIVFVQDTGTKEYFSHLLPGLGINNVQITTFSEWAMKIIGLENFRYVPRYGEIEEEMDAYEYQKIKALREEVLVSFNRNVFITLHRAYKPHLSLEGLKLLQKQKVEKVLDRFDLTLLLKGYLAKHRKLEISREVLAVSSTGSRKVTKKKRMMYSLIVVDEFQNYLPEQLSIFKKCLKDETDAILYVGDMAQQVYLGTIKDWSAIGEQIAPERNVRLDKVYRNTKSILTYIQSLGYSITLPPGIKDGPVVTEKITQKVDEEIAHIEEVIKKYEHGSIGVISKSSQYLQPFKEKFGDQKHIHIMTMNESQGVEFDLVCIVGINENTFVSPFHGDALPHHLAERKTIQKDLLYVALTRAITELHILGSIPLKEAIAADLKGLYT